MISAQTEVFITLAESTNEPNSASGLLDFFGVWSQENFDTIQSVLNERQNFSTRGIDE
jgi:hypothetical protein